MMQQHKTTLYCYIAFAVIGIVHSTFVIIFALMEDVKISEGAVYEERLLNRKKNMSKALSVVI